MLLQNSYFSVSNFKARVGLRVIYHQILGIMQNQIALIILALSLALERRYKNLTQKKKRYISIVHPERSGVWWVSGIWRDWDSGILQPSVCVFSSSVLKKTSDCIFLWGVTKINEGLCLPDQWGAGDDRHLSIGGSSWCICVSHNHYTWEKNSSPIAKNLTNKETNADWKFTHLQTTRKVSVSKNDNNYILQHTPYFISRHTIERTTFSVVRYFFWSII